jgi:hypothetical protein
MKTYKQIKNILESEFVEFDLETAIRAGDSIGVDWSEYDQKEFLMGMNVELEHADITRGAPALTAKIVLAHLKELPDYYTRLKKMEDSAKKSKK